MKATLRNLLCRLAHASGAIGLVRTAWPRRGAVVLMGHRVRDDEDAMFGGIPPALFERQVRYLKRHYRCLSLTELWRHMQERRPVGPNSVVLTFDDGWRDNYTDALPILRAHGVPAIIYLVTRSIDEGELPWPQRIGYVLQHTAVAELTLDGARGGTFPLRTEGERRAALVSLKRLRSSLALDELEALAAELAQRCAVDPPRDRMLTWDQVRQMRAHGIEFGAHTVSHPLLAHVPFERARWELAESKRILESRLGEPIRHFAFPGGSSTPALVALARELGFETVFAGGKRRGTNTHESDPFALSRVGATADPLAVLAAEVAGVLGGLRRVVPRPRRI